MDRCDAAIIIPTRGRASYLDVALASVLPQARAAGAEVLVVLDGPDPASAAVASAHGVRVVAHESPRGLNAARNTGLASVGAGLCCFVDDDVRVRDGWLAALCGAHAALDASYGLLTGPVVASIEDHRFRTCGREGPPVTWLDLGEHDVDAPHAWGANLAVRRTAVERVGGFDEAHQLYGDEQEWQERLRAAELRIRYVAGAALEHRRAGDDARLLALMRAARRRGRAARREDVLKGSVPALRAELALLVRVAVHGPRFACMNGPVLAAHSIGRVEEAGSPSVPPSRPGVDDFLSGRSGTVAGWRAVVASAQDALLDLRDLTRAVPGTDTHPVPGTDTHPVPGTDTHPVPGTDTHPVPGTDTHPVPGTDTDAVPGTDTDAVPGTDTDAVPGTGRRVLVVGVERPGSLFQRCVDELQRSRAAVTIERTGVGTRGKFENLDLLLAKHDLRSFDWVLVLDDDVTLPRGFLDRFLDEAGRGGYELVQPAHRRRSHAAWAHTRRRRRGTSRPTTFVEIGPVTAFGGRAKDELLPFGPGVGMGWGLDAHWSALGYRMGIVDATPIGHTAPAGEAYSREAAIDEARRFLAGRPYVTREQAR